jgi:hypothetical protein
MTRFFTNPFLENKRGIFLCLNGGVLSTAGKTAMQGLAYKCK